MALRTKKSSKKPVALKKIKSINLAAKPPVEKAAPKLIKKTSVKAEKKLSAPKAGQSVKAVSSQKIVQPEKTVIMPSPAEPLEIVYEAQPAPVRAPTRKVIGPDNTVTVVEKKVVADAVDNKPVIEVIRTEPKAVLPQRAKVSWTDLPQRLPASVRYIVSSAKKEAEAASSWPFSFAKFISTLPQALCGTELSLLILNLEHGTSEISSLCDLPVEEVDDVIQTGENNLYELFAASCPEIYRKWKIHVGGMNESPKLLVEQYLVSKVDPHFQELVAALILRCLSANLPLFSKSSNERSLSQMA